MEHLPHSFIKHLRSISLTGKERGEMRIALLTKMREGALVRPTVSPWSHLFYRKRVQAAFLSILIIGSYGSSVTLAAENALPGEILYPIKTRVTEPVVRLVTATTPAAEAKFETRLLEKRLEEVETLETREKLDPELTQEVRKVIREQSIKAKKKIKDVESDEAAPVVLPVSTSTAAIATSSPEATPEKVGEVKQSGRNDDSDDKEKGKNKRALNAVLEKHGRIIKKLDLADEYADEREDKGDNRDKKKED